jgi:uncharacterized membrane protein YphA (DoxX/SURF4 family)
MRWKFPFLTAFFLVLLRLAIGWHFLYEGYHKVHSFAVGPVDRDGRTVAPFSSAGYFKESHGPLGDFMRHAIGDPDEQLLERLAVVPFAEGKDPGAGKDHLRMPPSLARDWESYLGRFASHYGIDAQQRALAQVKLEQAESKFVQWLTSGSKTVEKTFPSGKVETTQSTPQRVDEYREALGQLREVYAKELPAFGRDVEKARLLKTKAEVQRLRDSLEKDIEEQAGSMKKALADVLTENQHSLDALVEPKTDSFLERLDIGTAWFLFGVGAALLFGLLTRTSCVLAAAFLLMTYLNTPAFPWLPVPPNQEGSYYFVSKNVIEMLALLALATTPSGRWFGIDGLVHATWRATFARRTP